MNTKKGLPEVDEVLNGLEKLANKAAKYRELVTVLQSWNNNLLRHLKEDGHSPETFKAEMKKFQTVIDETLKGAGEMTGYMDGSILGDFAKEIKKEIEGK